MAQISRFMPERIERDYIAEAVSDRLISEIKADLKGRIMPQVVAEVDAAVDAVVAALGPQLEVAMRDNMANWSRDLVLRVTTRHVKADDPH